MTRYLVGYIANAVMGQTYGNEVYENQGEFPILEDLEIWLKKKKSYSDVLVLSICLVPEDWKYP